MKTHFHFIALISLLVVPTSVEPAIVRRADRADELYLKFARGTTAVGSVGRGGDATLISSQWALTAAHVANGASRSGRRLVVRFGFAEYAVSQVVLDPKWKELGPHDLALLQLETPVKGVNPIPIYRGANERGVIARIFGHGGSGVGTSRARVEDGRLRAATTRVDSMNRDWLFFSFDAPPRGTTLEGAPGPGDSGGPALIAIGRDWFVAGVSSGGYDGKDGPGTYGAVDQFARVSTDAAWIDQVMKSAASANGTLSKTTNVGTTLPHTPIGRRANAFLAAMSSGTDASLLTFLRANFASTELARRSAEQRLPNFRNLSRVIGNAELVKSKVATSSIVLHLRNRAGAQTVIELLCEEKPPYAIVDWRRFD